ncbi:MAG: hypothetical protein ACJ73S_03750, partial [Mycobacteriales bacterium]
AQHRPYIDHPPTTPRQQRDRLTADLNGQDYRNDSPQLSAQERTATDLIVEGRQESSSVFQALAHNQMRIPGGDYLASTNVALPIPEDTGDSPGRPSAIMEDPVMAAAHESAEHAMMLSSSAISESTIEQLHDDVVRVARDYTSNPPRDLYTELIRIRRIVHQLIDRTRRPAQLGELYLLAGTVNALASATCVDMGRWDASTDHARATYQYGEMISHDGMRSWARASQALIKFWTGEYSAAVRIAAEAVYLAPAGHARVRALTIAARAWAYLGAGEKVDAAIEAARAEREVQGNDVLHDVIGGEFAFTRARTAMSNGTSYLTLGRGGDAAREATAVIEAAAGEGWDSVRFCARADLAAARLLDGELEGAVEALAPVWDVPEAWRRHGLTDRMRLVASLLARPEWEGQRLALTHARLIEDFVASVPAALPAPRRLPAR